MTASASLLRRLALGLVRLAVRLLPPGRGDWADAMIAELQYVDDDRSALAWAGGCVIAVIRQRMRVMTTGNWKISRWIIAPEMLLCFLPLTIVWLDSIGKVWGVVMVAAPPVTAPWRAVCLVIAMMIVATLGPAGLIAAFRLVALARPLCSQPLRIALIAGPILFGALLITWRLTIAGLGGFDFWSGLLLGCGLPLLGAVHLLHLSWPESDARGKFASSSPGA